MAYCINCQKSVGCSCNLIEGKFCSQKCKDEYQNKLKNAPPNNEVLQQLQQSETTNN